MTDLVSVRAGLVAPPDADERSDAVLVTAVARGDEDALAVIYGRHGVGVFGLASRLCGPEAARAVTQAVFLGLWRSPEDFDPGRGSLRSWLLARAHADAVDVLRNDGACPAPDTVDRLVRHAPGPATTALSQLPLPTRQAIILVYFGGYSCRRAAVLLHQPEETIKARIGNGLSQLRTALTAGTVEPS